MIELNNKLSENIVRRNHALMMAPIYEEYETRTMVIVRNQVEYAIDYIIENNIQQELKKEFHEL